MLALGVRRVPDPHGTGVRVARQMIQLVLDELPLTADAVHDLQIVIALGEVGDEAEEVDRLPVVAEGVEPPQGERGVANPGEAVVVVAAAAGSLGKGHAARRRDRTGRGVGEALQGQGAALQVAAPRVVGEAPAGQPVLPVVRGPDQPAVGLVVRQRWLGATPRQGDVADVALLEQGSRGGLPAFEAEEQVGGESESEVGVLGRRRALVTVVAGVLPMHGRPAVVQDRLALHDGLDLARDAANGAQQDVFRLVVVRSAAIGDRAVPGVVPRPDDQHVAHDDPAGVTAPAGLQDHRSGQVATLGRYADIERCQAEVSGAPATEDRAEDAGGVEPRQAHPGDCSVGCQQRRHLAIAEEAVVADRHRRHPVGRGDP